MSLAGLPSKLAIILAWGALLVIELTAVIAGDCYLEVNLVAGLVLLVLAALNFKALESKRLTTDWAYDDNLSGKVGVTRFTNLTFGRSYNITGVFLGRLLFLILTG